MRDRVLHLLLLLGVILLPLADYRWPQLPAAVDWHTIMTLTGLLMLTKGLENSGYFDVLGARLAQGFQHERTLALFMCAAALLSTFLTNDVALFIPVPLTLTLRKFSRLPISRLIIFEALAVNAGSLLTPVGNPQNILWSHGTLSVAGFIGQMPLAAMLMLTLVVLTWFSFPRAALRSMMHRNQQWQKPLFIVSVLLYVVFIVALELKLTGWRCCWWRAVFC